MASRSLLCSDTGYSFPSGHATIVSGGGAATLVLFRMHTRILISGWIEVGKSVLILVKVNNISRI